MVRVPALATYGDSFLPIVLAVLGHIRSACWLAERSAGLNAASNRVRIVFSSTADSIRALDGYVG